MTYSIGIEGIAQRFTLGVIADVEGHVLEACRLPFGISLHTTPRAELRSHIFEVVKTLAGKMDVGVSELDLASNVCIGLTGVTFPYDAIELERELATHKVVANPVACTGDVEIAFASHAQVNRGSAIVCHLGSTAFASTPQENFRYGGWGPIIGDEGSSFAMGLAVLRAIGEEYDQRAQPSKLWLATSKWLGSFENPPGPLTAWEDACDTWSQKLLDFEAGGMGSELRSGMFSFWHTLARDHGMKKWRSVAGSLTVPLMWAHEAGDENAKRIVDNAVDELVRQHAEVCKVARISPQSGPVLLYGGMFRYNPEFTRLTQKKICFRHDMDESQIEFLSNDTPQTMRPVCGALLFALGGSSSKRLVLPSKEIVDRVRIEQAEFKDLEND